MGRINQILSKCKIWGWHILIFLILGSQKFQFNRLLMEFDRLIEINEINEKVYAQIGYSNYEPKNFEYKRFLDRSEFLNKINDCNLIVTHGGTGSIVTSVKLNKKVIAVPRLLEYGEHVDNHQKEIVNQFVKLNMIHGISEVSELKSAINLVQELKFKSYVSNTDNIINIIESFLKFNMKSI